MLPRGGSGARGHRPLLYKRANFEKRVVLCEGYLKLRKGLLIVHRGFTRGGVDLVGSGNQRIGGGRRSGQRGLISLRDQKIAQGTVGGGPHGF